MSTYGSEREKLESWYRDQNDPDGGFSSAYLQELHKWLEELPQGAAANQASATIPSLHPAVAELAQFLTQDPVARMLVTKMIEQVPGAVKTIEDVDQLLAALDHIITHTPPYSSDPNKQNFFPMSALFVFMMMTPAGEAAFRHVPFNDQIRRLLDAWRDLLDSPASLSVIHRGPQGWLSPSAWELYDLDEYIIPDPEAENGGFTSFNAFFHRHIKPEARPIDAIDDPRVVVSANDGSVFRIARGVQKRDRYWIKAQPYSLCDMFNNGPYVERFLGGDVFQSFLCGANYHRWRAPIAGIVRRVETIQGLMFSNAESAGYDPTAGTYSQGYLSAINTRGLVFIESDDPVLGMVAIVPIGVSEISSVDHTVEEGQRVQKGDELGYFSYGGSSICLVFQPGAIDRFTVEAPPATAKPYSCGAIRVNAQIAVANTQES